MAKSLEDTAFYRYHRLLALNEVGGDPAAKALSVDAFHGDDADARQSMAARHDRDRDPRHQARRGCARADHGAGGNSRRMDQRRGAVEAAQRAACADRRRFRARRRRRSNTCCIRRCSAHGSRTTRRFAERMQDYALKAAREGKQETSWLNPHEPYEAGVKSFIAQNSRSRAAPANFSTSLQTLAQRLSLLGALNSLSQITLKATMPGVPDFYQGTELWDFSLVDPDNRRPVDFAARAPPAGDAGGAGLGSAGAGMAERPSEAGLDPATAEAANRTGRCIHGRRLRAAGSDRAASRSFHRLRAAARPRGCDRRGPAMVR